MTLSRRTFLGTGVVTLGLACATPFLGAHTRRRRFAGGIVGANSRLGHQMRDNQLPTPTVFSETGIVIVGSGIAGLAAARRFQRRHFDNFLLLEMESRAGGNAISGQNEVSAFPWAAHYVPIAGSDCAAVTELFEELGVITNRDSTGSPVYAEEYLCADPMERLFIHGRWQEGFLPQLGITAEDQRAIDSFLAEMQRLKTLRGSDGRRAFTLPLDQSSRDREFLQLDAITMAEYLRAKGWFESPPLRWYVDYCCRDDYGAGIEKVSAWAGIHYFACRDGQAANAPSYAVVTWPQGNGWFVEQMSLPLAGRIRSSCAVWNVEQSGQDWLVDCYDETRDASVRIRARGILWAAPHFVARRAIRRLREQAPPAQLPVYSPWMVANLTLDTMPGGRGMDLSWDNVFYASRSLGYVVATHQDVQRVPRRTVITYYLPLDDEEPAAARQNALNRSYEYWCDRIVADISVPHPDIADHIARLDVWVWGHAMIRPVPGFIWGPARPAMQPQIENLAFAHSDLSGLALFEEAYTRGVEAADKLLTGCQFNIAGPSAVTHRT